MKSERRKFGKALIFAVLFATLAFVSVGCASADLSVTNWTQTTWSDAPRYWSQDNLDATSYWDLAWSEKSPAGLTQAEQSRITSQMEKLHIPFIANQGQTDESVMYYAKSFGGTVFITKDGQVVYSLPKFENEKEVKGWVIKESFVGASISNVKGEEEAITKVNYFKGKDAVKWRRNISTYNLVSLGEVYDGIEIKLKAYGNNVEKLFYVKPNANPEWIKVRVEGAKGLKVNENGELVFITEPGPVRFTKPFAYQEIKGKKKTVEVAYVIYEGNTYGFKVANYDNERPLIIDPLLASTFIGGSDRLDWGRSIAIDETGNVYVTGHRRSSDYPTTTGAYDESHNGYFDVFVSKLDSSLSTLLASTFIGGSSWDGGFSIAIDGTGNIYVIGYAGSSDYPTTSGAYDESFNGYFDVFVSRLDGNLSTLLASTFIGGGDWDVGHSIAIDGIGNVYVTGDTSSSDYPTTPGAYDESYNGNGDMDVFVSRLDSSLSTLLASTFIGASDADIGFSIAFDEAGKVYVTGFTESSDYPTTPGAYDESYNGNGDMDVFVSRLDMCLSTLLASTFIGGGNFDEGHSIAIDGMGNVYVTGETGSSDYPTTPGAYDESYNGYCDVFVSKLDSNLSTLLASTFIGGGSWDHGRSIAIDETGNVYITGETGSSDYPTTPGAYDESYNGDRDVFVSRLDMSLGTLLASTFIGGGDWDEGNSIAIDETGNVYITGRTGSPDYPTTPGAYDESHNGGEYDVFVARLDRNLSAGALNIEISPTTHDFGSINIGSTSIQTFTVTNIGNEEDLLIGTLSITGTDTPEFIIQNDNCSGQTVAPSDTCTVDVVFAPTSGGSKSANLSIPSNDPDTPALDVPLTGTGVESHDLPDLQHGTDLVMSAYCENDLNQPCGAVILSNRDFISIWCGASKCCYSRFIQSDGFTEIPMGECPRGWGVCGVADLNVDGIDDLVITFRTGSDDSKNYDYKVAIGQADGSFNLSAAPIRIVNSEREAYFRIGDIDGDELSDLLFFSVPCGVFFTTYVYALYGQGDGTFTPVEEKMLVLTSSAGAYGLSLGDFDEDGDLDIFLPPDDDVWDNGQAYIAFNKGSGVFEGPFKSIDFLPQDESPASDRFRVSAQTYDVDLDGHLDIIGYLADWVKETLTYRVYWGDGTGQFSREGAILSTGSYSDPPYRLRFPPIPVTYNPEFEFLLYSIDAKNIRLVPLGKSEHDIAVTSIDAPNYADHNSTIFINSTISNIGLNNESNVSVDFLVDGVNQSNTTIPFLERGNSTNVNFQWTTPNVTGIYNITIYAEPVVNEGIVCNNQLSKDISVITPPVFTDVASEYGVDDSHRGYSAVWFDYDNDRDLDILITPDATAGGDIYTALYRNDGDTFVDVADEVGLPGLWSHLSVGDYDNDGDIDILYARLFQNDINKTGNFTGVGNYGQTFVDYDNDGDLDTYSALFWGSNKLFRNDGAAGFVEIPGALGLNDPSHSRTSVWGDYDDDGDMDVYLVNGRGEKCLLYRNDVDTTGLFTDVTDEMGVGDAERYANGASWADYDNDGDLDLYLNKCETGTNRLYRNDGEVFTEVAAELGVADKNDYGGFHSSWGDYDNDGDLDLYVTSRDGCANRLYRNEVLEGNGFVETGEMQDISGRGMGGSWGDFDSDGDLDYYLVSGYYGTVPNRLYLNNCSENGNHWLHINAIGTLSNRAAIGTTIRVVAGDLVQTRYVESTSGFGSQNSLLVEFGLGDRSTVDSVIIKWPSGIVQRLTDVATNQVITVTESTIQSEHDIAVTSIDAPHYAEPNSTIFINSTISNVGLNNGFNITTNFLVDEVNQSNTTISFIESGNSTNVSFQWSAPSVAGIYNITIYAEPVSGENITGNNLLSKNISVITLSVHNINTGESFPSVQAAIDDSDTKGGHTITVTSGTYYENVNVNKQLILRGTGKPAVDANGSGSAITLSADGITLEGFNATNSGSSMEEGAGIKVTSNNNIISGNNVSNNSGDGIVFYSSSNNNITKNNVCNNNWYGIILYESSNNNTVIGNNAANNPCGIGFSSSSNNNITENNVSNNNCHGIVLYFSSNNNITKNNVSNNSYYGIALVSSSNNNIKNNTFVNAGLTVSSSYQNSVEDNKVNGKPLVYLEDASDYKVEDAGQVILLNCNNITVENLDLSNTSVGVELWETEDSIILNNTVSNNRDGIRLYSSSNNLITENNVSNNRDGIRLYSSSNCTVTGNNVNNNWYGIFLDSSSNNNTITGNNACNNSYYGIVLGSSGNNKIYLNIFINNSNNAYDSNPASNDWHHPVLLEGNYWSDYTGADDGSGTGRHAIAGDGIGDTDIPHPAEDYDFYPFMNESLWSQTSVSPIPPVISSVTDSIGDLDDGWGTTVSGHDYTDIVYVEVVKSETDLVLRVTMDGLIPTSPPNDIGVLLLLDIDRDPTTGHSASPCANDIGYEYMLQTYSSGEKWHAVVWEHVTFSKTSIASPVISENIMEIVCPLSMIENPSSFDWVASTDQILDDNRAIDRAPSTGHATLTPTPVNELNIIQAQTDKITYALNENITVSCIVQNETGSNITANSVNAEVLKPDSSTEWVTMTEGLVWRYNGTFTNTSLDGTYNVTIYANKTGYVNDTAELSFFVNPWKEVLFDTWEGTYPRIMGTHKGEIKPSHNITISKLYTYPCAGTGEHTESIELYDENDTLIANGTWNGHIGDYRNITIHNQTGEAPYVTLLRNQEYRYVIKTGSYPQIIHKPSKDVTGGTITCTSFVDANGKVYTDWIPAIRLE